MDGADAAGQKSGEGGKKGDGKSGNKQWELKANTLVSRALEARGRRGREDGVERRARQAGKKARAERRADGAATKRDRERERERERGRERRRERTRQRSLERRGKTRRTGQGETDIE